MGEMIALSGPYADILHDYVAFRQNLGSVTPLSPQRWLARMAEHPYTPPLIPEVIDMGRAGGIASRCPGEPEGTRKSRFTVMRRFCIHLNRIGIEAFVPPPDAARGRRTLVPRIVGEDEMARIMDVADSEALRWPPVVLEILWRAGLRVGEVAALRVGDFDPDQRSLYVAHAKYDRSRVIPVHQSLADDLEGYIGRYVVDKRPEAWLLPGKGPGTHRNKVAICNRLHSACLKAGVLTPEGKPTRTHDIRHPSAIKALENMVSRGEDACVALPPLSAYMGHANISGTEYYLRLLPSQHQEMIDCEAEVSRAVFGGDAL